jgi:hypothetical protein
MTTHLLLPCLRLSWLLTPPPCQGLNFVHRRNPLFWSAAPAKM